MEELKAKIEKLSPKEGDVIVFSGLISKRVKHGIEDWLRNTGFKNLVLFLGDGEEVNARGKKEMLDIGWFRAEAGKFKELSDFDVFNMTNAASTDGRETVTFSVEDFKDLIISVKSSVIFEISEAKKTISGHAIDVIFKYIEGKAESEDVLAELNNLKHQSCGNKKEA